MTFFEELKWRGVVKDISSPELEDKLNNESLTFYLGTDPTADSLHIGHYASFVTAKRLARHGHKPIILIGGATGLIGDPRPTAEREIISKETVAKNIEGLKNQVNKLLEGKAQIVNNYEWMKDITFLDFLRDIGKYINVNYMLNKDIINRRLETGITYAEFSYTLMQGYDFVYLNRNYNCTLQAAGSDQWGNITTGIELARKMDNKEVYGFTMPLILDANGKKFGKSEGNALWLDAEKTSPYKIYQYLINTDDSKVIEYLKVFTFLTKEEIEDIEKKFNEKPEERLAQKTLAFEVVKDIHGIDAATSAKETSEKIFKGEVTDEMVENFRKGISFYDGTLCLSAKLLPNKENPHIARVIIREGKYHQVKKMFLTQGLTVRDLHREQIGMLKLPKDLAPGECRFMQEDEKRNIFL